MHVLTLDRDYSTLGIAHWHRAITLVYQEEVQVLAEYPDWVVTSPSVEVKVPSVIRFLAAPSRRLFRQRHDTVHFTRENLLVRDRYKCQYCGRGIDRKELTYDHVIPRSKNGTAHWGNIVSSCSQCNQRKGGRTPEEAGMKLLQRPVKPRSLPYNGRLILEWRPGMPESWRAFMRDQVASIGYWHGELETEKP